MALRKGSSTVETQRAASLRDERGDHSLVPQDRVGQQCDHDKQQWSEEYGDTLYAVGDDLSGDRRNVMID
jgi:hypothetical protein